MRRSARREVSRVSHVFLQRKTENRTRNSGDHRCCGPTVCRLDDGACAKWISSERRRL